MLARLDREMAPIHVEVDQEWHWLLRDRSATRDDYRRQLVVTYGFESPVELACVHTPGLAHAIDLRGRWRAGLIVQDLLALGAAPEDIPSIQCHSLARFHDPAEALAWMYVIERPTLIHGELRDELTSRFVDVARATAYLGAYDGTASKRWAGLGIALDRVCVSDKVCKRVIDAAHAAYCAWSDWRAGSAPLRSVG
ncbi:MAG TPA: biliverdin-producing heme oxygenase [Kofleriaceae bacterium]